MKSSIAQLVARAIGKMPELASVPEAESVSVAVERTRDARHGDFATNIAMRLAKSAGTNPRELAQQIIDQLPDSELVDSVSVAGPGFINFFVSKAAFQQQVEQILDLGSRYGRLEEKTEPRYLLEFVSANPTGPLHIGHGRLAAFGATLGNLLEAAGYPVDREYYVNDSGRQMDILGVSVLLRRLEANGLEYSFPEAGYKGDYIRDIAGAVSIDSLPDISASELYDGIPADSTNYQVPANTEGDETPEESQRRIKEELRRVKEAHISALIERAIKLIGTELFNSIRQQSLESIRDEIREDLAEFGVDFDHWYSEQSLSSDGRIDEALDVLKQRNMLYQKEGHTWFRATDYGDEKDRVVVRENGVKTYFASDIAYHFDKRKRGYDMLLDVLGSDHHGYVARVRAGLEAMGYAGDCLDVELVQFVSLYRNGEKQSMSTRAGEFITLRQLREEVGNDAARFYYVMRSNDQHLDFDLDLAKSRSNENPVYYIQYAHARVASVFRQLQEKSLQFDLEKGFANLQRLEEKHELALMNTLSRYQEVIELAAANRAPQHLVHYLRDLANEFHAYYNAHTFIVDDTDLRDARLALITATKTVVASGLAIIGVSAPDSM